MVGQLTPWDAVCKQIMEYNYTPNFIAASKGSAFYYALLRYVKNKNFINRLKKRSKWN